MKLKPVLKWSAATIFVALVLWVFIAYWTSTNDCNAPLRGEAMKAIKVCEYGVDRLQVAEVTKPVPSDDQVLIKVRAASLNALDVFMIRDTWFAQTTRHGAGSRCLRPGRSGR